MLQLFQIDCVAENELTARINMADAKFSFQEKGKILDIYIVQQCLRNKYIILIRRVCMFTPMNTFRKKLSPTMDGARSTSKEPKDN